MSAESPPDSLSPFPFTFPSSAIPQPRRPSRPPSAASNRKAKQPNPAQLIAMYQAEGLSPKVAAHEAIIDLQKLISKLISKAKASPARKKEIFNDDTNTRLSMLEMKVDSMPGMGQMLGLQLTATAIVQSAPHVFRAFGNIWTTVRNSTK